MQYAGRRKKPVYFSNCRKFKKRLLFDSKYYLGLFVCLARSKNCRNHPILLKYSEKLFLSYKNQIYVFCIHIFGRLCIEHNKGPVFAFKSFLASFLYVNLKKFHYSDKNFMNASLLVLFGTLCWYL